VTTSFARSSFAEVAGTPFFRSLSSFIPCVNVSLMSSSRGISMGGSAGSADSESRRGVSSVDVVQDFWNNAAASMGVDRLRDVISSVFCSISRCNDCTRANSSASNGSMSTSTFEAFVWAYLVAPGMRTGRVSSRLSAVMSLPCQMCVIRTGY